MADKLKKALVELNKVELNLRGGYAIFAILCMSSVVAGAVILFLSNMMGWGK